MQGLLEEEAVGVLYRGANADDAGAATEIFAEAINHLNETRGFSDRPA